MNALLHVDPVMVVLSDMELIGFFGVAQSLGHLVCSGAGCVDASLSPAYGAEWENWIVRFDGEFC